MSNNLQRFTPFGLIIAIISLSLTFTQAQDEPIPAPPEAITHLIVISVDGLRPDAIPLAEMPNLQALAERGAFSWTAQTVDPPGTLPAHTSMLTGTTPDQHQVDWNATNPGCPPVEPATFLLRAAEAGYQTAVVAGKEKFCHLVQSDAIDFTFARAGDGSVVDRALELLEDGYDVMFLHLPNADYFGHLFGWMSETYLYELGNTDRQIGRVLTALDDLALTDETLVIVTSDHGGIELNHGIVIPETMTIPWIITGAGVMARTDLSDSDVSIMDTAATALWALRLPLPDGLAGVPVYAAFEDQYSMEFSQ